MDQIARCHRAPIVLSSLDIASRPRRSRPRRTGSGRPPRPKKPPSPKALSLLVFPWRGGLAVRGHERLAVTEERISDLPRAAGRAAAQGCDLRLDLVAGLQRIAPQAVAHQRAGARAFEAPDRVAAVRPLDL